MPAGDRVMNPDLIVETARLAGFEPDETAVRRMARFVELVQARNRWVNLTAVTDEADIAVRHLLDSFMLLPHLHGHTLIDVGTGGGFPGMILKLARPDLEVVLLDALRKRVDFLNEAVADLGLDGVRAVHGRAEELGRDRAYREGFDLVTARAVTSLDVLAEFCLPFVRPGGVFLAMKGRDDEAARGRRAIARLGGSIEQIDRYVLPGTDMCRTLLHIVKKTPTDRAYPRKMSVIKKRPLC